MSFLNKDNLLTILTDFKGRVGNEIEKAKPTKVSQLNNDAGYLNSTQVQAKADAALQAAKEYINQSIGNVVQFDIEKVEALPETSAAKENTIYLVPIADSKEADNIYDEYLLIDSKWEHLGTTEVDLSGYYTSTIVDQKIEAAKPVAMTDEEINDFNNTLWS